MEDSSKVLVWNADHPYTTDPDFVITEKPDWMYAHDPNYVILGCNSGTGDRVYISDNVPKTHRKAMWAHEVGHLVVGRLVDFLEQDTCIISRELAADAVSVILTNDKAVCRALKWARDNMTCSADDRQIFDLRMEFVGKFVQLIRETCKKFKSTKENIDE